MNREIKFRVFDGKSMRYFLDGFNSEMDMLVDVWKWFKDCEYNLMQFTGLKDKNGVDIYEGDVIRYDVENIIVEPPNWYVCDAFTEYGYENLGSFRDDYDIENEPSRVIRKGEIIGNIYENPELLNN